jgi:hypothetical protein
MPSKQFLKGKHQLTLYPTTKQLEQLKQKMAENGYKTLTKYLIDMGLNATVKTVIAVDSTHKNNTVRPEQDTDGTFPVVPFNPTANQDIKAHNRKIAERDSTVIKPTMVKPLTKGGK